MSDVEPPSDDPVKRYRKPMTTNPYQMLTIKEVASLLRVSLRTMTRLVERHELKRYELGTKVIRYKMADVNELLERLAFTPQKKGVVIDPSTAIPEGLEAKCA